MMTADDILCSSLLVTMIELAREEPDIGVALNMAELRFTDDAQVCQTAMVQTGRDGVILTINLSFMRPLNNKRRAAIFKHEALHILFGHLLKPAHNYLMMNICMDALINQFIKYLPASAILPNDLPAIALGKPLASYPPVVYGKGIPSVPPELIDVYSALCCENLVTSYNVWPQNIMPRFGLTLDKYYRYMEVLSGGNLAPIPSGKQILDPATHEHRPTDIYDEILQERLRDELKRVLDSSEKPGHYGSSALRDMLRAAYSTVIDWRKELFDLLVLASQKHDFESSWKKPNRRFGVLSAGESPASRLNLAVVIDTSGSMSQTLLGDIEHQLLHLLSAGVVAPEFPVIFGDSGVGAEHLFYGKFEPSKVVGGGGTDMQPMITHARRAHAPDIVLICTDGHVPSYELPGSTNDLVWVIPESSYLKPAEVADQMPGRVIRARLMT